MDTSVFFATLFNNAQHNCIIVMNTEGDILEVNKAFCEAFGYSNQEIVGKNFRLLFTEEDLKAGKPAAELQKVKSKKVATDDNYLVNKDGSLTWVSGESVYVNTQIDSETYVIKMFQNINAQKQLERFLLESGEFFEVLMESTKDVAILVLDSMMRILKVNTAFTKMFELEARPGVGDRLSDINHSFWMNEATKKEIRNVVVTGTALRAKRLQLLTRSSVEKTVIFSAKTIHMEPKFEREIFIMIREENGE